MSDRDPKKREFRCFVQNISFDLAWQALKDFFKDKLDDVNPFVDFLRHPSKPGVGCGGAFVEFHSSDQVEKALALDKSEVEGRKLFINHDPDGFHSRKWATRFNFEINFNRGRAVVTERGGAMPSQDYPPHDHRGEFHNHPPPPPHHHPHAPPPHGFPVRPPMPLSGFVDHTPGGKPIINDVTDLLASTIFYSNFPWRSHRDEIKTLFETCGQVRKLDLKMEPDDHEDELKRGKSRGMGLLEFARARDAHRSLRMIDNSTLHSRTIHVRMAKELRPLPAGLSDLGRPLPEQQCIDQCRQAGIDPFVNISLFVVNIPFDLDYQSMKEVFSLVGDVLEVRTLKNREDGRSRGMCVVKLAAAMDAQQCINVFNEASMQGRKMIVKFDTGSVEAARQAAPLAQGHPAPQAAPAYHQAYAPPPANYPPPPGDAGFFGRPDDRHVQQQRGPEPPRPVERRPEPPRQAEIRAPVRGYEAPPPRFNEGPPQQAPTRPSPAAHAVRRPSPPARREQRSDAMETDQDRMTELAGLLGINQDTLNALKILQSGKAAAAPAPVVAKVETSYSRDSGSYRESSYKPKSSSNGYEKRDRSPHRGRSSANTSFTRPTTAEPYKQPKADPKTYYTPVTNDTIYIRNLPKTMTESQLRYLMSSVGTISFCDFPVNHDSTPVGYAYVRFDGKDCYHNATRAVSTYDGHLTDGAKLEVGIY